GVRRDRATVLGLLRQPARHEPGRGAARRATGPDERPGHLAPVLLVGLRANRGRRAAAVQPVLTGSMARSTGLFARGWRSVREAGWRRLALTALLLIAALLLARFSWLLPVTEEAERSLYDLRSFVLAEQVEQDNRIALVVYTDQTLIAARKRSPLDRGLLA